MEVSKSDKAVLQIIIDLTGKNAGRPPTLSEIAVAAGLQSSSRANIQRQLTKLKPIFVDWNSSSRSIHVTEVGMAILGMEKKPNIDSQETSSLFFEGNSISELVLPLMASGLVNMVTSRINQGKPVQAPYPKEWQRGLNILVAECLLRGIDPPSYLASAIEWCKTPIINWPVRINGPERLLEDALLDEDEQPTLFCQELAQSVRGGNAELEIYQRAMAEARNKAERQRLQAPYVALRRYLIEHPVVSQEELILATLNPDLDIFDSELHGMYEDLPNSVIDNGRVLLCGFCGWTLSRSLITGRLRCGDDRCRILTKNFTRGTTVKPLIKGERLMRVNRAIRKYVVAAGKYEIDAFKALEIIGVKVELWPGYDSYDLRITYKNGESWAVDVKDWQNPYLLLRRLDRLPDTNGLTYNRAFYAIPDERSQEDRTYIEFLRNATSSRPFNIVKISELIEMVRQHQIRL